MTLFEALDLGMGSAIYISVSEGFYCTVEDHPDGGWLVMAIKLEDARNPRRQYMQHISESDNDWEELVKRVSALPFGCDPESNWKPNWEE